MSITSSEIKNYDNELKEGTKILRKNKFFQDFTSLMRNNEFRIFYQNYFKDWSDIQTMIFYMKIYTTVEEIYYTKYNQNISDELMTYTLHQIITTNETRKVAVELFKNFKGEESKIVDNKKLTFFSSLIDFDKNSNNILLIED